MSETTLIKDTAEFSINLFNNSLSNLNATTTVKNSNSNSNNIPLIQLPLVAKAASSVAPTSLTLYQNVTNCKFVSDPIDKITKELSSANITNNNNLGNIINTITIPPVVSNLISIPYRFLFEYY